ncbi:hypothetical protein HYV74_04295 [Candidatus Uhrbacteria bacterium]|nr:hypothetical protein [Candidatus Uhrbacteria bacterium]
MISNRQRDPALPKPPRLPTAPATAKAVAPPPSPVAATGARRARLGDGIRSGTKFVPHPPSTIVVACADGRYTVNDADLLEALKIPEPPDRQSPAGGPATYHALSCHRHADRERGLNRLAFLVEHHATQRIILVNHEDCAHYKSKFAQDTPERRRQRQLDDLLEVRAELRRLHPAIRVDCYFARALEGYVTFFVVQ